MSRHFIGLADGTPLHVLGTDKLGRDIFSRGIVGSRISLAIALSSIALITIVGTLTGIASGYIGGKFDLWFQRFVEIILAFPQLPFYLTLATLIPVTAPSGLFLTFVVLVIVGLGWAQLSREVRSKTMAMARVDYVRAAMAVGASDGRIITRHILPNVMSHVIVSITLGIPYDRAPRKLPRLPRLRGEAAADLLGPDAAGRRHLLASSAPTPGSSRPSASCSSPSSRSTRSATACATRSTPTEGRPMNAPAKSFGDIVIDAQPGRRLLQGRRRHHRGRARRLLPAPQGPDHRARRRVGLRQVRDRPRGDAAPLQARPRRRRHPHHLRRRRHGAHVARPHAPAPRQPASR